MSVFSLYVNVCGEGSVVKGDEFLSSVEKKQ